MVTSYQKIRDMRRKHNDKPDLRTAAFIVAIDMIAVTYSDLGIFPRREERPESAGQEFGESGGIDSGAVEVQTPAIRSAPRPRGGGGLFGVRTAPETGWGGSHRSTVTSRKGGDPVGNGQRGSMGAASS